MSAHEQGRVDVVVIGGGVAGLSAALAAERNGLRCQILEAQDRLGGRLWSVQADSTWIDLGGQLVNGDMASVLKIAQDAGLHLAPVPSSGAMKTVLAGGRAYRDLDRHSENWMEALLAPDVVARVQADGASPSLGQVLDALALDRQETQLIHSTIAEMFGQPAHALDGLGAIKEMQSFRSARSDVEFQFRRGFGGVVEYLAGRLHHEPRLKTPVRSVVQNGGRVLVQAEAGSWSAAHVVIAVPPSTGRRIHLATDDVDAGLASALDDFIPGDLIKFILTFDRPFWRYAGLSGQVEFSDPAGLNVVDASLDDGSRPRLAAFLGGPLARQWAAHDARFRKQALLDLLEKAFGEPVRRVHALHEGNWVDHPWCGGGYNSHIRVGGMSDACSYLAAWGRRVVFAGAEIASRYRGYVEGALMSGETALQRTLALRG